MAKRIRLCLGSIEGDNMIDLDKPQILTEPIKCWAKEAEFVPWVQKWLLEIQKLNSGLVYITIHDTYHSEQPTIMHILKGYSIYSHCTLVNPYIPEAIPWKMLEDVPDEAWGGWLLYKDHVGTIIDIIPNNICRTIDGCLIDFKDHRWKPKGSHPLKDGWKPCVNIKEVTNVYNSGSSHNNGEV